MNQLVPVQQSNVEAYRTSTDAASLCKEIVVNTATNIQGRKYVCVEGWQAIAIAHGCTASARDVERIDGGVRAIGEVRRMSDGAVIAEAEGFVGEDEPTWYGGESMSYGKRKVLPKRADYAIRAMAQTRAISRACRSAFAHVVVMMNAGLSTTPAEEVPHGGFDNAQEAEYNEVPAQERKPAQRQERQQQQRQEKSAVECVTPAQELMLEDKMREAGVDPAQFLARARIRQARDLPASQFAGAMRALAEIIAEKAPQQGGQKTNEFADIGDDCVPY